MVPWCDLGESNVVGSWCSRSCLTLLESSKALQILGGIGPLCVIFLPVLLICRYVGKIYKSTVSIVLGIIILANWADFQQKNPEKWLFLLFSY
jgi:hypothetical protein